MEMDRINIRRVFTQQSVITDPKILKFYRNLEVFRNIYAANILAATREKNKEYRVPRLVHQIWLGSPLPERYVQWMQTWMNWRGWEYKLWTDKEVKEICLYNQDLYDSIYQLWRKIDLHRLEILLHYGGFM